jgi:hypothetical protein
VVDFYTHITRLYLRIREDHHLGENGRRKKNMGIKNEVCRYV